MAKSRSPGKTSCSLTLNDINRNKTRLSTFRELSVLKPLYEILGAESELFLVGGSVRDLLLGKDECDLDLATALLPEQIKKLLNNANIKVVETGIEHGTLTAVIEHNNIEITTFREPSSRKESRFSNDIETDLSGRDFTINAIAYSLNTDQLIDPFSGIKDLTDANLKAVGNPSERFEEDPQRILRMFRFGPAEGREIDSDTLTAASKLVPKLSNVAIERITSEFEKILTSPFPEKALRGMHDRKVLELFIPEILPAIGCEQNEFHTEDVFDHTLTVISRAEPTVIQRLSALFHDLGKPSTLSVGEDGRRHFYRHEMVSTDITKKVMKRLKFSKELTRSVMMIVQYHMRPLKCGPSAVRRLMRDLGDLFDEWRLFKIADKSPIMTDGEFQQELAAFDALVNEELERLKEPEYGRLQITGDDLISLGMPPGRELGLVLKTLEEMVIEDPALNDTATLRKRALDLISKNSK